MAEATKTPAPATAATPAPKEPTIRTFKTEAEATAALAKQEKGARKAFKVEFQGKTTFALAANWDRAAGNAFLDAGGKVNEIGKAPKTPKSLGLDGIMAAIKNLPESEQQAIKAQLANGAKK